jgi:hypothetical protein
MTLLDPSRFEKGSIVGRNQAISTQIYRRGIDGVLTVVKAVSLSGSIERRQIETEMENLLNLHHPMITPLIGCILPVDRADSDFTRLGEGE